MIASKLLDELRIATGGGMTDGPVFIQIGNRKYEVTKVRREELAAARVDYRFELVVERANG